MKNTNKRCLRGEKKTKMKTKMGTRLAGSLVALNQKTEREKENDKKWKELTLSNKKHSHANPNNTA
jgi:hypothetical protein